MCELCCFDLMRPRLVDADGCISGDDLGRQPFRPPVGTGLACGDAMNVDQSIVAAMGQPLKQPAAVRHRPIVRRPADPLWDSRRVDFTVESGQLGDVTIVTASGELDAHAAPALEAVVGPLSQRDGCDLVVDLSAVAFIDSTGLGVLVSTLKHVRESDGRLEVVVATPRVLKVFTLTGLDVVIPLHGTLASALAR